MSAKQWFAATIALVCLAVNNSNLYAQHTDAGDSQLARWDVLLNNDGLDTVKQVDMTAVTTKSKIYQAFVCDATALRGAVAQAVATGGLESTGMSFQFGRFSMPTIGNGSFNFDFGQTKQSHIFFFGSGPGQDNCRDIGNGRLHLGIDYPKMVLKFGNLPRTQASQGEKIEASFNFDGTLEPGQAVAFIGTVTPAGGVSYHHLVVWESFKAPSWMEPFFEHIQDGNWWIQNGPETLRADAAIGVVWGASAAHATADVPAEFSQKLEDGKTIVFEAITNMRKWPFCWWDGAGKPVYEDDAVYLGPWNHDERVNCEVRVVGEKAEVQNESPLGPSPNSISTSHVEETAVLTVDKSNSASVGVPVGPWTQVGEIHTGKTIVVDGATWHFVRNWSEEDQFNISIFLDKHVYHPDLIMVTAVWRDGTETAPLFFQGLQEEGQEDSEVAFLGSAAKVKVFHVWKRKRQWVTFSHIPLQPSQMPKQNVSREELAAARPIYAKQHRDAMVAQLADYWARSAKLEKEFDSIAPDPSTPRGALRALLIAAANGDEKAVRSHLTGGPEDDENLNLAARQMALFIPLRNAAVAKFGPSVNIAFFQLGGAYDIVEADDNWHDRPGGGLQGYMASIIKGENDQYCIDISKLISPTGYFDVKSQIRDLDIPVEEAAAAALKANPNMTLDQFEDVMQTRPIPHASSAP